MEHWKREFLYQLKQGVPPEKACRSAAGKSLADVLAAREADTDFAYAWEAIAPVEEGDARSPSRVLAPQTLEALLWAGCPDEEIAAYFSLDKGELAERIAKDVALKKTYDTARLAGKAALRLQRYEAAMAGDRQMQIWLSKQLFGESEKTVNMNLNADAEQFDLMEIARRWLWVQDTAGLLPPPSDVKTLDAEPVHVIEREEE